MRDVGFNFVCMFISVEPFFKFSELDIKIMCLMLSLNSGVRFAFGRFRFWLLRRVIWTLFLFLFFSFFLGVCLNSVQISPIFYHIFTKITSITSHERIFLVIIGFHRDQCIFLWFQDFQKRYEENQGIL